MMFIVFDTLVTHLFYESSNPPLRCYEKYDYLSCATTHSPTDTKDRMLSPRLTLGYQSQTHC